MDAPRKSKLSIQLEEMKSKGLLNEESDNDNNDYLSDFEEEENIQIVNNKYINNEINLIKKFNVQFYFDFKENKKYVLPISIENFNVANFHIYDLIIYIVKKINNSNIIIKDNNIKYSVSLRDVEGLEEENIDFYINNYEIKPFDPLTKNDFRNFSPTDPLKSINEENISFFSKNPLNILLIKLL